ncbi:lactonase family protein [Novosphingobium terrae]|uniref:lactonase family protein n=1 Tax=Novosphingobium terrae TaxID=2726189 RepID=UPI00197E3C45|nr:lactonase family protein [Novosphingobium terrae]
MNQSLVFVGTQGVGPDGGIHVLRLDEAAGQLDQPCLAAVVDRPTWVMADPNRSVLYAVSEMGNAGDRIGDVLSFAIDLAQGTLAPLSSMPSGGSGPTHLTLDAEARSVFVANFGGGQVAVLPVSPDGALQPVCSSRVGTGSGPHRRQKGPHAHGVTLDPSGRFLLAPDMGADRIFIYPYDPQSQLLGDDPSLHVAVPAGAGPRLLLFGKDGRFAYLLTELSAHILTFGWAAETGTLTPLGTLSLDPPQHEGEPNAAGFTISRDGRFLYATNRRTHTIHAFAIDSDDGRLTPIQTIAAGGDKPWALEISPTGRWMLAANQASDEVRLFKRDAASGQLAAMPDALSIAAPTSFAFVPARA